MKKAFLLTVSLLAIISVAALVASNVLLLQTQANRQNSLLLVKKLSFVWDDVREDLKTALNVTITQNAENLSIGDQLPAPRNVLNTLAGYAQFVENYYRTSDINISYLSTDGNNIGLTSLGPPMRIMPFGINYSYPDQAKQELNIDIPPGNLSVVRQINVSVRIPQMWFTEFPFSDVCGLWSPLKTCGAGTTNCLTLWMNINDKNGTSYNNTAACSRFDVDQNSALTLNLANETTSGAWVRFRVGQLPGRLVDVDLHKASINTNTTFTFNNSAYTLSYIVAVRVHDNAFNASKSLLLQE